MGVITPVSTPCSRVFLMLVYVQITSQLQTWMDGRKYFESTKTFCYTNNSGIAFVRFQTYIEDNVCLTM